MTLDGLRGLSPILEDLSGEPLKFLESVSSRVEFAARQIIFEEDDPAGSFFVIERGRVGLEVAIPAKEAIIIETLGRGDLLGISSMFPPARWNWTARALEATEMVAFDAGAVRARCLQDTELAVHVYATVAAAAVRRLNAARVRLLDLYPGHTA